MKVRIVFLMPEAAAACAMSVAADARPWRNFRLHHREWRHEYVPVHFGRGDFYGVLNYCRKSYPWANSEMNAEFTGNTAGSVPGAAGRLIEAREYSIQLGTSQKPLARRPCAGSGPALLRC